MAKQKKASVDNTRLSLAEFKAWLAGVSDMQPATWSPDKQQWEKIKSQIDRIQETKDSENPTNNDVVYSQPLPLPTQTTGFIQPSSGLQINGGQLPQFNNPTGFVGGGVAGVPVDVNNPPPPGTEFI